ncbi:tetratricopeptide repeat protein [Methanobrevibacter arboriphilus]|uniref:tetratricopeptide repeat protein n=1 Tax=Methanobrevibacter arboriphilus TaxID=39441 RepID=UPI000A500CA7|nr:tetratricopeptide repeat protein [Methanobrevibacter arboriphilus]
MLLLIIKLVVLFIGDVFLLFLKVLELDHYIKRLWIVLMMVFIQMLWTFIKKILEIDKEDYAAWNGKGIALSNLDSEDEALVCFDIALKIEPNCHSWYNKGLILEEKFKFEDALVAYNEALKLNQDNISLLIKIAICLTELKRYDDALKKV